jgi:primosomal protein DnaI
MEKMNYDRSASPLKLAEQLARNPEVIRMLQEKGLKTEDLQFRGIEVSNWLSQKQICQGCQGLQQCNRPMKGYGIELSRDLSTVMKPCRYLAARQQKTEHRKNYLLCDLNEKALEHDIDKIDLSRESEDYRQKVEIVRHWLSQPRKRGIYFHGPLGVGKSYLAACMTNKYARQGRKVAFVNMPRLASDLRNNLREYDYVNSRVSRMRRADLLVLDDIGAENITDWIRDDILFTVLDYRMEHEKPTVFTSNSSFEDLKRRMMSSSSSEDETKALRIIERIRALSELVTIKGTSRRIL